MAKIIDPLKAYREANGLTQQAIAKKLRVSRGLVSLLETGGKKYTADMAVHIEETLGIPRSKFRPDLFERAA